MAISMSQVNENMLRQQLSDCTRMMVMAELLDYSGHISARIPGTDHILILGATRAAPALRPMIF